MTRRFKPPIYTKSHRGATRWVVNVGDEERDVIIQLLGELRSLLDGDDADEDRSALLARLFPTAYPDDPAKEAEYQRLMREDLVTSRRVQIDAVVDAFEADSSDLDESGVIALMQSVNAIRIVLGTMLDVGEDDELDAREHGDHEVEQGLYSFLSWFLEWIVRSLQTEDV